MNAPLPTPESQSSTPGADDQDAIMLAAFEGWNDAGSAASSALLHLSDLWDADQIDELDPEDYHDFQVNRPIVATDAAGNRELTWPTTTISVAHGPTTGRRIVLVHGIEPSMRWKSYCTELLEIARTLGVSTVVTLGALLADVPHTRPIPVTITSDDPAVQSLLEVEGSTYEGPTGIVGVLHQAAQTSGFHSLSVWAAVPHYVAHPPSPKATVSILTRLEAFLGETIPLGDLTEDAEAWQHGVDELAAEDTEIAEYVEQLEQAKDTVELPEASGEAIAREFEQYLRRRDKGS
ncbi:PAC2 family protein [Sanguibacter antarcticus]|uniref:PAC2 family protein n=1 Tax=Sanguibacter antarcticus TaxID=372484 RepID=A0A2A9E435_9MICO|nr:PAC2 family protein [Sanguibacter antarcticus]PFG33321.1 PAC2 family protein [Sanguibacter antarcticus]